MLKSCLNPVWITRALPFAYVSQRTIEIVSFGIPLYWMVGLAPYADSFLMYLALLICYTIGLKMMFGILAQTLPKKANVQGVGTFLVLLLTLFGGFIVFPDVSGKKNKFVQIKNGFLRYSHRS